MIISNPSVAHGQHPLSLLVRATGSVPTMIGGVVGLAAIITQTSTGRSLTETYALVLVTSTAGIGFALDDPASEIVAASPLRRPR